MSAPEMSDYARALAASANAYLAWEREGRPYSYCLTCRVQVPKGTVRCALHRDEPSTAVGCPECGGVGRCERNCERCA